MKKHISLPALLKRVRSQFEKVPDALEGRTKIPLSDYLKSGLAVLSLKMPSLLQFDEQLSLERIKHNLKTLYQM